MAIETIGTRHNRLVENNIDRSGQERCFAQNFREAKSYRKSAEKWKIGFTGFLKIKKKARCSKRRSILFIRF